MLQATDILVPVDFSACSINAVKAALVIASPEGDLTLLHVIDEDFLTDRRWMDWTRARWTSSEWW